VKASCKESVLPSFCDELYAVVIKLTLLLKVLDKINCFRTVLELGGMLTFKDWNVVFNRGIAHWVNSAAIPIIITYIKFHVENDCRYFRISTFFNVL
jgi:hypothetical protein